MQKTSIVGGKKDFTKDRLCIADLPEVLMDYIFDFLDVRENVIMASSCLAIWTLLNKNRHWFRLTGMDRMSLDEKKQILKSLNIVIKDIEAGIPEYVAKEYFLRLQLNHILKNYTEYDGDVKGLENTQLRNLLINSYKHIILSPHVACQFFIAFRSRKISKFLVAIGSCYPYAYPLLTSALSKLTSTDDNISYQKLPGIGLLKSAPTEDDILQVQKKALLIFRKCDANLFLHYMDPNRGYSMLKITSSLATGENNPHYERLLSLFSTMQPRRFILRSLPDNHSAYWNEDLLYRQLIKMIREMKVPVHSIPSTRNSAGIMCAYYAGISFPIVVLNLLDLLQAAFSAEPPPLVVVATLLLTIPFFVSVYFATEKVIEFYYGPIKADKKSITDLPASNIKLHHHFSEKNRNTYFQEPLSASTNITISLHEKKML